jgi:hypothetical protein
MGLSIRVLLFLTSWVACSCVIAATWDGIIPLTRTYTESVAVLIGGTLQLLRIYILSSIIAFVAFNGLSHDKAFLLTFAVAQLLLSEQVFSVGVVELFDLLQWRCGVELKTYAGRLMIDALCFGIAVAGQSGFAKSMPRSR